MKILIIIILLFVAGCGGDYGYSYPYGQNYYTQPTIIYPDNYWQEQAALQQWQEGYQNSIRESHERAWRSYPGGSPVK